MKKLKLVMFTAILALGITTNSIAQKGAEVVDFGDSGIEVVVEPDNGFKTGWVYWFPAELEPVFDNLPGIKIPPWAIGGSGGNQEDKKGCNEALQDIINITVTITLNEGTFYRWSSAGQIVKGDGSIILAGSEEYQDMMKDLNKLLNRLALDLEDAKKAAAEAC